ncbi:MULTISPECIES: hypothetical protein [Silvimonas]|uniref:hypothetical protein n=1 Tax=Silvimonas TaxID=300264 RepID=UPI0024B31FA2|nr:MULTISPECIES: hypothetical protein [Silvimonas]MDR3428320.1 hypothetical protein [Silvimonas sp.]
MRQSAIRSLIAAALLAAPALSFAALSHDQYQSRKDTIGQRYDAATAQCKTLAGNGKDVCEAQAKAEQRSSLADLDAQDKDTEAARADAARERTKANYDVAVEKCGRLAGNDKDVCKQTAKADRDKMLADIDANKDRYKATAKADDAKREADYKVAREKCDAFSGDRKDACVTQAKTEFAM